MVFFQAAPAVAPTMFTCFDQALLSDCCGFCPRLPQLAQRSPLSGPIGGTEAVEDGVPPAVDRLQGMVWCFADRFCVCLQQDGLAQVMAMLLGELDHVIEMGGTAQTMGEAFIGRHRCDKGLKGGKGHGVNRSRARPS